MTVFYIKIMYTAFIRIAEITNNDILKFSDLLNKNSGSLDVSVSEKTNTLKSTKCPFATKKKPYPKYLFYDEYILYAE